MAYPVHEQGMPSDGLFNTPAVESLRLSMDDAALRQEAISSNIANVNTPGYQRMDVSPSFQTAYTSALNKLSSGESISDMDMPEGSIVTSATQGPARPDGNTVQLEQEMVGMAQNSAKYEFAGQMLAQNFHGLKYAITGQN
jgi:flagellar basal-body rod protein FlgB